MNDLQPDVLNDEVLSQISQRGLALYNDTLRAILEPAQNGRTVAIHPVSGEYALARNSVEARRMLRARQPDGAIITLLVGPDQMDQLARRMLGGQIPASQIK